MTCRMHARTQSELAGVLGVNPRTLRDWIDNQGMRCFEPGKGYHVPSAVQWAIANRWDVGRSKGAGDEGDAMAVAELRCKEADAAIKEARAEQILDSLVNRDSVDAAIADLLNAVRDRLKAVPEEVAGVIPERFRSDAVLDLRDRVGLIITEVDAWQAGQQWRPAPVGPVEMESEVAQTAE